MSTVATLVLSHLCISILVKKPSKENPLDSSLWTIPYYYRVKLNQRVENENLMCPFT